MDKNIWKRAAKFWWKQFHIWEAAYNEIADKFMIDETCGTSSSAVVYFFKEA